MALLARKKDAFELGTDQRGKGWGGGQPVGKSHFQAHLGFWQDSAPVVLGLLPPALSPSRSSSSSLFGAPTTSLLLLSLLSLPGHQSLATESCLHIFAGLLWKLRFHPVIGPVTEQSKQFTTVSRFFFQMDDSYSASSWWVGGGLFWSN